MIHGSGLIADAVSVPVVNFAAIDHNGVGFDCDF